MHTQKKFVTVLSVAALLGSVTGLLHSQQPAQARGGRPPAPEREGSMQKIVVHGKSLEGNLEGESPDRDVVVYTPPGYTKNTRQRYPVVYYLHGYRTHADGMSQALWASDGMDKNIAAGTGKEMIVVFPDTYTKYLGSFYTNSPTAGEWETFITEELVQYVDSHYRTVATRDSRGLAGHSMGGYGTWRIAMKHPELFAAFYTMSACCLLNNPFANQAGAPASSILPAAYAAAWAPNPQNPPQYFDLPTKDGQVVPEIAAKYLANSPLAMVDQYTMNLRKFRGIAMDVGTEDALIGVNRQMDAELTQLGVPHLFETYHGTHTSNIKDRWVEKVVPFFSNNLTFAAAAKK